MSEAMSIGTFGDPRRAERGAWVFERVVSNGTLVQRRIGGDRAGELAAHRFFGCPAVTTEEIVSTLCDRTGLGCAGRRIIAVQDTTEINFRGRDKARRGLGRGGDGVGLGFFIHGMVAIDAEDQAVVGLLDAAIWTRAADDDGQACRRRRKRPLKESKRWLEAARRAKERASAAAQLIVVGDRESDIHVLFVRCPEGVEPVVRAAHDRALEDAERPFKPAAVGIAAAVRTIQLVDARDGANRPASEVADVDKVAAAHALLPTLEGKTARQKNPHPPESLAWLAWIIARLDGCRLPHRPPSAPSRPPMTCVNTVAPWGEG